MRIELRDLELFVGVAEAGGFRRAAAQLHHRQSVLSRRVRNLEEYLGASLFERGHDGVRLTFAGSKFLTEIRPIFTQLDSAVRAVRAAGSAAEGCIRIGTVAAISGGFLGEQLRNWHAAHGEVAIEMEAGEAQENIARVVVRQLDLAVVTGAPSSPEYETETLWYEDVFAALPSEHPLADRESIDLQNLQGQRFLVTRHAPGPEIYDWIVRRLSGLGSSPLVDEQSIGREALFSLVGLSFGVTFASTAETSIGYPNVSFVQVRGEQLPFSFVWSRANDNPALRRFLSEARALSRRWPSSLSRTPGRSP